MNHYLSLSLVIVKSILKTLNLRIKFKQGYTYKEIRKEHFLNQQIEILAWFVLIRD